MIVASSNNEDELNFDFEQRSSRASAESSNIQSASTEKVTRASLAKTIGDHVGLSQQLCNDVVVSFFDTIKRTLISGESVKIQNFATFGLRDKNARPGRNPKTGEEVEVSARRVVTFRPSHKLRDVVASRASEDE